MSVRLGLAVLVGVTSIACGPATYSQVNSQVLQASCGSGLSDCHSQAGALQAANLNFSSNPFAQLVNVAAATPKAAAEGLLRVKPGDSANSFLYMKVTLTARTDPKTGYGAPMPYNNPRLPDDQIQLIKDWIDAGALDN